MVRYIYDLQITNKIIFNNNKIFYENISSSDTVTYTLDIYLYPHNKYMNNGTNINQ